MSVHDRPSAAELVAAVRDYLHDEVVPTLDDRRARFRARVAANVLAIVERELQRAAADEDAEARRLAALGFAEPEDDGRRALCASIRAGKADDDPLRARVFAYAREAVTAKLRVANPKFLESVSAGSR